MNTSQLKRLSRASLADILLQLDVQKKAIDKKLSEAKAEAVRRDVPTLVGGFGQVTVTTAERSSIDTKTLRAECPEVAERFTKTTTVTQVRCKVTQLGQEVLPDAKFSTTGSDLLLKVSG